LYHITNKLNGAEPVLSSRQLCSTQEFPNILWNPQVHCRVHKNTQMVSILSQINPIHITQHVDGQVWLQYYPIKVMHLAWRKHNNLLILSRVRVCEYKRGLDLWIELLTTYAYDSELQAITAPPLISTNHK
jgi:hypothetical protein